MLLTRSPLSPDPKVRFSLDLHVLSAPPAFVLSQDQTLREDWLGPKAKLITSSLSSKLSPAEAGDGFFRPHARNGIASDASCMRSRRIRTAEFSKTDAVAAGA